MGRTQSRPWPLVAAYGLLLGANAVLMAGTRLYPFHDLPWRLAIATIVRHYGARTNEFSHYFQVHPLLRPNGFFLAWCSLPVFPSVEAANHAFWILYVILLPLSLLFLIRRVGGNAWFGLLGIPLLYNHNVHWGLVEFVAGIPMLLILAAGAIDFLERPRVRSGAWLVLASLVLLWMHVLMALFFVALFIAFCFVRHGRRAGALMRSGLILLPVLAAVALWLRSDAGRPERELISLWTLVDNAARGYWGTLFQRIAGFFVYDHRHLYAGQAGYVVAFLLSLGVLVPAARGALRAWRYGMPAARPGAYAIAFAGVALLAYALLPSRLTVGSYLFQRFTVLAYLGLILVGSLGGAVAANGGGRGHALKAWITGMALVSLLLSTDYFRAFDREVALFDAAVLPDRATRGRLAGLILSRDFRGWPVYEHFPGYQIVWNQGIAVTVVPDLGTGFVTRRAGEEELPARDPLPGDPEETLRRYAGIEFLLVKRRPTDAWQGAPRGYRLRRRQGEWSLWEIERRGS